MSREKRKLIDGKLRCPTCKEWVALENYYISPGRVHEAGSNCKPCVCKKRASARARREKEQKAMEAISGDVAALKLFKRRERVEPADTLANFLLRNAWDNSLDLSGRI